MLRHGMIFYLGSAEVCTPAIIETDISNDKVYGLLKLIYMSFT